MTLTEIEALADAASGLSSWQCDIPADDIKAMCQLIRQMVEVCKEYDYDIKYHFGENQHSPAAKALAKFEEFNK